MEQAIKDLLQGSREAVQHLENYLSKVSNDAHKRRIVKTITKLEKGIAELADVHESI